MTFAHAATVWTQRCFSASDDGRPLAVDLARKGPMQLAMLADVRVGAQSLVGEFQCKTRILRE